MKRLMYSVDKKKWNQYATEVQLKNIAAELSRASHASIYPGKSGAWWAQDAYERAISLIDASIADAKWKDKHMLYELRDAVASLYAGQDNPAVSRLISSYLAR